jgi:hypothetical protein
MPSLKPRAVIAFLCTFKVVVVENRCKGSSPRCSAALLLALFAAKLVGFPDASQFPITHFRDIITNVETAKRLVDVTCLMLLVGHVQQHNAMSRAMQWHQINELSIAV